MSDLSDFFKLVSEEKKKTKEELDELISGSFEESFVRPLTEQRSRQKKKKKEETSFGQPTLIQKSLGLLAEPIKTNNSDPLTPLNQKFLTLDEFQKHYKIFIDRVQQQLSTLGGGGEVRFEFLDDVDRSTFGADKHLEYNPNTKTFFFTDNLQDDEYTTEIYNNVVSVINLPNEVIGPVQGFVFDTTHQHETKNPGTLCWNDDDDTLNIQHSNDVIQQVGQELYLRVRNETGLTIPNGNVVRFSGATNGNGIPRLLAAPFLADGTFPSLYTIGVATQDIEDDEDGLITVFGRVSDLDTTGIGVTESWALGDILYAHPSVAGGLTKVKPTAPNNVVPIAAIIKVDSSEGELFVRPTIEQKYSYGLFERTTDLSVAGINTAYVVDFDTTEISNGVSRVVGNTTRLQVDQSGLYQIDISAQVDVNAGGLQGATMYMWIRKNGDDVPDSTRRQGVIGAAPSTNLSFNVTLTLNTNDYIQVAYAGDNTDLKFDASAATAFAPSTAAVKVGVTQVQL